MAPLSRDLAGLILPHSFYGTHLNDKNETVNTELEKKNFARAGQTLAEIWSSTVIDGFETVAKFKDPDVSSVRTEDEDVDWITRHVTQSQYLLQVVKCNDQSCCLPRRSQILFEILDDGRLPPPIGLDNSTNGKIKDSILEKITLSEFAPLLMAKTLGKLEPNERIYDRQCPSVQSKLVSRTCNVCGKYFSAIKSMKDHMKLHKKIAIIPKQRQRQIITTRGEEILAVIENDNHALDVEWMRRDEINLDNYDETNTIETNTLPIIDVNSIDCAWTD